jgi:polysaccharide deacetylase family protein (PEP-CTERM system associated)
MVPDRRLPNAMTVDLEDWPQAVLDPYAPVTDCVARNAERVLRLLDELQVRATFFALSSVCQQHPHLVPMLVSAGHEVASHGHHHQLVYRQSPGQFADDLKRSIDIIGAQAGRRPRGYRAPAFSITRKCPWAADVLASLGFEYSSSVFPIAKKRYGIADAPRFPHRWPGLDLIECPMTTLTWAGRNFPACGGGYMRLMPAAFHAQAIRQANALGHPAVIYMHPYELAIGEVHVFRRQGMPCSSWRALKQSLWRNKIPRRLAILLSRFRFVPMEEALRLSLPAVPSNTEDSVNVDAKNLSCAAMAD